MIELLEDKKNTFTEHDFIEFLNKEGITVKTNTKARGHLGICFKNRIDVSKKASKEKRMSILAHEYAHKIHADMEKDAFKKGGSLEKLFNTTNTETLKRELVRVTHFVDENSVFLEFHKKTEEIIAKIKALEVIIRQEYPDFKRSKDFKPINAYFKKHKSNARYFLKYDRVKLLTSIFRKEEYFDINNLDKDFLAIPESLRAFLKLKSLQRYQKRLSAKKSRIEKYYNKPTELFARFIEGLFSDPEKIKAIAPHTCAVFCELLNNGYYGNLKIPIKKLNIF